MSCAHFLQVRKKKNLVPCPPLVRGQFDGVSSNWGKTNFAFHEHLVRLGIMPQVSVVRNPVASTHEDVDGLFAREGLRVFSGMRVLFAGISVF